MKRFYLFRTFPTAMGLLSLFGAFSPQSGAAQTPADSAAQTVQRFHEALASGDSSVALALLAPDVLILESGDRETREEYRSHHLAADIAFASAVTAIRESIHTSIAGDVAWVASTGRSVGTFRGKPVNSQSAELVVLSRDGAGWRIRAIHWSSRNR